jgi:hypothetical protein
VCAAIPPDHGLHGAGAGGIAGRRGKRPPPGGFIFSLRCLFKRRDRKPKEGRVVLKGLAKLTFGVATLTAATSFLTSPSHASGDAPWCAVINTGQGSVYWDCQYPTFEACYHRTRRKSRLLQFEPVAGTIRGSPLQVSKTTQRILKKRQRLVRPRRGVADRGERREAAGAVAQELNALRVRRCLTHHCRDRV